MKKFITATTFIFYYLLTIAQAPTSGLVSYYKLDGNYTNEINTALNGTNFGSTATANKSNSLGCAMQFDNPLATVAQYATHPPNASLNFGAADNFSVSLFAFINSPIVHSGGLYDNNINYGGYGVYYTSTQASFIFRNNQVFTAAGAVPIGTWFHLTCVRESGVSKIYINGVLNASATTNGPAPSYTYTGRLGTMFFNSSTPPQYNGHHGKLDELRIYNRALSLAEIGQIQVLLPIKLNNFTASLQNNKAILNWQTAQEQDSKQFIVERSTNGQNFEAIQTIVAAGISSVDKNYSYIDNLNSATIQNPILYYRIKMEDLDGSFTLSKIVPVIVKQNKLKISLSPNPVIDIVNIQTSGIGLGITLFSIMDLNGKVVIQQSERITQTSQTININIKNLLPSTYFLKVTNNNNVITQKFIKQ